LIAARHRDKKAAAALRQEWGQLKALLVLPHESEVFGEPDQLSAATGSQLDLLFR
jgi:hypothetical protein